MGVGGSGTGVGNGVSVAVGAGASVAICCGLAWVGSGDGVDSAAGGATVRVGSESLPQAINTTLTRAIASARQTFSSRGVSSILIVDTIFTSSDRAVISQIMCHIITNSVYA